MSYSFSQLQDIKARVVRDLAAQQAAQKSHEAGFEAVDVALSNMQTTYTEWAADINSYIAANPTNPAGSGHTPQMAVWSCGHLVWMTPPAQQSSTKGRMVTMGRWLEETTQKTGQQRGRTTGSPNP